MTDNELFELIDEFYALKRPDTDLYSRIPELSNNNEYVFYKDKMAKHGMWKTVLSQLVDDELREKLIKALIIDI
jgi:hypothetical protein